MRILLFLVMVSFMGCGITQTTDYEYLFPVKRVDRDSTVKVSKEEFLYLIKKGTAIADEKEIKQFSNDEHILVVMLLNSKSLYIPETDKEINEEYDKFFKKITNSEYAEQAGEVLRWMPNWGMGMNFPDLDLDYGGSKMFGWGFFEIINCNTLLQK